MAVVMRAKLKVVGVKESVSPEGNTTGVRLNFCAVGGKEVTEAGYPVDGSDEDNTFARWTPSANLGMDIQNPSLFGKFFPGQKFYVNFLDEETVEAERPKFVFNHGDEVAVGVSGEVGCVVGRADYDDAENKYLVRYKAADGRAQEVWWAERALKLNK